MRLTNTTLLPLTITHATTRLHPALTALSSASLARLSRGLSGALVGIIIAFFTLGFFALVVGWPDLLSIACRPTLAIGCLFGLLAGFLRSSSISADAPRFDRFD